MIKIDRRIEILFKILLLISWTVSGYFFSITQAKVNYTHLLINSIVIFVTVLFLIIKRIKITTINKKTLIIATILSCYTGRLFMTLFDARIGQYMYKLIEVTGINKIKYIFYSTIGLLLFPTILFCIYLFIDKIVPIIKKEIKSISLVEKRYLITVLIIGTLITLPISFKTSAFQSTSYYLPHNMADIIFTGDNDSISKHDAWTNFEHLENDLRQPLFTTFSLPISIPCHITSDLLFFVPKDYSYFTMMTIVQFLILAITTIILARLINIKEEDKKYFYILFSLSFPYILFGLILEQYVVGFLYLILTIYYYFNYSNKTNYLYVGAVGTLITSGIVFPLIAKIKPIKEYIKKSFDCFLLFLTTLILSGQFIQILTIRKKVKTLFTFTGMEKVSFTDKIYQYTSFIESLFTATKGKIMNNDFNFISYQLTPKTSISIIGIIILLIVFISFILNRKNKMALVSFLWILFSFILLVVVGWGTKENGLILYSLYFAWAFYSLIFLLLNKIKNRKIFITLTSLLITIMFIFTSIEMINILKFAFQYYSR